MTTETREQLFARLGDLGFEKVSEMRNRGILDGEPVDPRMARGSRHEAAVRSQQPAARGGLRSRALRRRRRKIRALHDVCRARRAPATVVASHHSWLPRIAFGNSCWCECPQ